MLPMSANKLQVGLIKDGLDWGDLPFCCLLEERVNNLQRKLTSFKLSIIFHTTGSSFNHYSRTLKEQKLERKSKPWKLAHKWLRCWSYQTETWNDIFSCSENRWHDKNSLSPEKENLFLKSMKIIDIIYVIVSILKSQWISVIAVWTDLQIDY